MREIRSRFVKLVASLAQTHSAAGLLKSRNPIENGLAGWRHVMSHALRFHREISFGYVADLASEMDRVRLLLGLQLHGIPAPSTLYRSFDHAPMSV